LAIWLETRLLKSENHFIAQHLLSRDVGKLTDDHVATIYEAYQADMYLSLEDLRRKVQSNCPKMDSTKKFVNTVLTFRGVIGSGGLSTTSTGHTIRYINRFG
jgi:nitrogen fixation/metabolism regulation signal transduction histidine kinase